MYVMCVLSVFLDIFTGVLSVFGCVLSVCECLSVF